MLTSDDTPTIRFAINRRLGAEPGVTLCAIKFAKAPGVISVGVLARLGNTIITTSRFELPDPFEHGHLLAEIDEIAEQYKLVRKDFFTARLPVSEVRQVPGTGTRGNWARYGLRMSGG